MSGFIWFMAGCKLQTNSGLLNHCTFSAPTLSFPCDYLCDYDSWYTIFKMIIQIKICTFIPDVNFYIFILWTKFYLNLMLLCGIWPILGTSCWFRRYLSIYPKKSCINLKLKLFRFGYTVNLWTFLGCEVKTCTSSGAIKHFCIISNLLSIFW